jgi:phosphoribosylglycinamide formyltransferase-1
VVVDHTAASDRAHFEAQLIEAIEPMQPDLLVFAGFMRILTPYFLSRAPAPGVNLHPSLLPAFPGAHAIDEAFAAQVRVSGCTTHLVTPTVDAGPVLMQGVVPLHIGDSPDSFADRMHAMEHQLLPASVRAIAEGNLRLEDGNIVCDPNFSAWIPAQ